MIILGITGPTGAGKSLFSDYLRKKGFSVIDADQVYHALLIPPSPCVDALSYAFGKEILHDDGTLNRSALSDIVFHDEAKLSLLNDTVLGFVLAKIRAMITELECAGKTVVAIDAPTLIESGFHKECDTVISVLTPSELRLHRIVARDGISVSAANARINAQKEDDFYRSHSDHVLLNDGSTASFFRACDALLLTLFPNNRKD